MGKSGPRFGAMFWAGAVGGGSGLSPPLHLSPPYLSPPPQTLAGGPDVRLGRPSSPPLVHPFMIVGEHLFNPLVRVEVLGVDRGLATGGAAVAAAAVVFAEGGYVVSAIGPAAQYELQIAGGVGDDEPAYDDLAEAPLEGGLCEVRDQPPRVGKDADPDPGEGSDH